MRWVFTDMKLSFEEQKYQNKQEFQVIRKYVRENPLEAVFDLEEDPSIEFKSIIVGDLFLQIDARIAPLLLLQTWYKPQIGLWYTLQSFLA